MPYLNELKLGIFLVAVLGGLWYWTNLTSTIENQKTEIENQKTEIATLTAHIEVQNNAALNAAAARTVLQNELNMRSKRNAGLLAENNKLKGDITLRATSKTCEDAMMFLGETAKKVAEEFNLK